MLRSDPPPPSAPSLTIHEMRSLHASALSAVESKRTELRLVLASRYKELVGSSDEVTRMRERSEELHRLVSGMAGLAEKVVRGDGAVRRGESSGGSGMEGVEDESDDEECEEEVAGATQQLFALPRLIHRYLDAGDVHSASYELVSLCRVIRDNSGNDDYPLAAALAGSFDNTNNNTSNNINNNNSNKGAVVTGTTLIQMKMVYLHIQTLPSRLVRMAQSNLRQSSPSAHQTAASLSSLDLLSIRREYSNGKSTTAAAATTNSSSANNSSGRAAKLLDYYYESKAASLKDLLQKLTLPAGVETKKGGGTNNNNNNNNNASVRTVTENAESVLSEIVKILHYDVILFPYMIFVLRDFPEDDTAAADTTENKRKGDGERETARKIMSTLPPFDPDQLKSKASRFLAAHLPLIRTKVKSVLMVIAGTTASKLGRIRQSLYDKTDGAECIGALNGNGVCTWDEAVGGTVDVRVVTHGTSNVAYEEDVSDTAAASAANRRFSLWGALFSNTFSSLVHSLLTASFHSVHSRVVSTLRTSLARAPPFASMLPHEAHRNALRMSTDLDGMLRKVSDDAHELLVHAEEREESERRLRQSLYVQTCEIMGRLLNELRRMLLVREEKNPGRELIVGRLCHLLKFRLKTLPTLLDPKSSPAVLAARLGGGKSTGMITRFELQSSFDLADDDDDGLISFDEAMEAMESAFSGTHFHGAEMVRDTLLLVQSSGVSGSSGIPHPASNKRSAPKNVTLSELALLSARGLRHDVSGPESALGTVQSSLDDIVHCCFREWARAALSPSLESFTNTLHDCIGVACTVSDMEWRRLNSLMEKEDDVLLKEISDMKSDGNKLKPKKTVVGEVSSHVVSYLLALSGVLNRSICPADSLPPVPSLDYAQTLGISMKEKENVSNMMLTIRGSLLTEALTSLSRSLNKEIVASDEDIPNTNGGNAKLNKCSPSSLIQILMDVKFIYRCFFERNHHGFGDDGSHINDSQGIIVHITEQLSKCVKLAVVDGTSIDDAISERHSRVFSSCDLFFTSLFGERDSGDSASSDALVNGVGQSSLLSVSSDSSFLLNPLVSSRRFVLLPIQAEKLTEIQLRGKYGKKAQEEKTNSAATSGNAIGAGFGFLSSMLSTKTR